MRQVDRDVLPLRVTLQHAFEREFAADAAWALAQTLVHLNPTSLDRVRRAQRSAEVVRPNLGGEPIMAVVGHADRVGLVGPRALRNSERL
jgi:hypothetical protein